MKPINSDCIYLKLTNFSITSDLLFNKERGFSFCTHPIPIARYFKFESYSLIELLWRISLPKNIVNVPRRCLHTTGCLLHFKVSCIKWYALDIIIDSMNNYSCPELVIDNMLCHFWTFFSHHEFLSIEIANENTMMRSDILFILTIDIVNGLFCIE